LIDFRYHVVSIVAVFLALALGLFIGSTTLQTSVANSLKNNTDRVARENANLVQQRDQATTQLQAAQRFDAALEPTAVSGKLSGQLVVVVSAPGVNDGVRKPLLTALDEAGATVTADVRLQSALVDPKQDAFLTALTDRIDIPGHSTPVGTGAERAAAQLAAVLGVRPDTKPVPSATVGTVLSAYSTGGLLTVQGSATARPGTLAIVLTPTPPGAKTEPAQVTAEQALLVALGRDLDGTAVGAVLAGPTPPAGSSGGVIAFAKTDTTLMQAVSTVEGVDGASGRIAAVLALAAQLDGEAGSFGASEQPPLPVPSSSP
jgi:hypothetical protein